MVIQVTFLAEEWTQSAKGGALSTLTRQLAIYLAHGQQPNLKVGLFIPKCSREDKEDAGKYHINIVEPEEYVGRDPVDWLGHPPDGFTTGFIIGHDIKLGWQGQAIRKALGCKWIHVVHTNAEEMGMCKNLPGAISAGQGEHENQVKLCEKADMVITIGPKLEDSLSSSLRFSGKEIFNLTPGIFDEFCNVRKHFQARKTCTLLIFGRGDDEDFKLKGFDVAAKAVGSLDDSTYHLMVVGAPDGRQEELATKLCSHGIPRSQLIVRRFYKDRKQLANFLSEADLLLMPSGTEAFGLVALEALSADLPILVTSNSGIAEALREVLLGSQCIVDSEEDWAKKIKEAWKGIKVRQDEAKCLRERYTEKYSWEEQCDTLVIKMQSMLSVYPPEPDEDGNDVNEESGVSEEEMDETSDNEQPNTSGLTSSGESGIAISSPSSQTAPKVKEGTPEDDELHELAEDVSPFWRKLGRELKVEDSKLAQFNLDNHEDSYEKAYQMLMHWRQYNEDAATYQILFKALSSRVVGRSDLAKKYCCEMM